MNQLKTAFLLVAMTVLLVIVGRGGGQMIGIGSGGIYLGLVLAVVMNGSAYWFSDRIALASAQAREVSPADAPMLYRLADRLAIQYGVPRPRVYVSPDPSPNAFATARPAVHPGADRAARVRPPLHRQPAQRPDPCGPVQHASADRRADPPARGDGRRHAPRFLNS